MPTPAPARTFRYLSDILFEVFPVGTLPEDRQPDPDSFIGPLHPWRWWQRVPFYAADLFAFCAHLINLTGAMGYLDPHIKLTEHEQGKFPKIGINNELLSCEQAAQAWRREGEPPEYV
jgi:hypothetical protein